MASDPLTLRAKELQLLDAWQHGFPRTTRPFRLLGEATGLSEMAVVTLFRNWLRDGTVSRIGAVLNSSCFPASALVAMRVPPGRLHSVADYVSAIPEVNHNYEREHAFNLWFVLSCRTDGEFLDILNRIKTATACSPIALRMETPYHIDLGFSLNARADPVRSRTLTQPDILQQLSAPHEALMSALLAGLDAVAAPYEILSAQLGIELNELLATIERWLETGVFKRFGVVLQHRALGYTANAMCVWDVNDCDVDRLGEALADEPGVTLCYRRTRHPDWPYNLFCMIHGKQREAVLALRARIADKLGLDNRPHAVLFSKQQFKQRGARLAPRAICHDYELASNI